MDSRAASVSGRCPTSSQPRHPWRGAVVGPRWNRRLRTHSTAAGSTSCISLGNDALSGEPWPKFVERCTVDTLAAVARWPSPEDLPSDMPGRILYNLTWVSEAQQETLGTKA